MLNKGPSISLPFVGGLDTKADSKMTPMGSFQVLENALFTEHGSIKKRWGYDAKIPTSLDGSVLNSYVGGVQLTAARSAVSLSGWRGGLLLNTERDLFAWSDTSSRWSNQGMCPAISVAKDDIPTVVGEQSMGDTISNGVITANIWEDSRDGGSVRASVVDSVTGFVYVHDYLLDAGGSTPRCGMVGTRIMLIWSSVGDGAVRALPINDTDPAASMAMTASTVLSGLDASNTYDVVVSQARTWVVAMTTVLTMHEIGSNGVTTVVVTRDVATEFSILAASITHLSVANVYGSAGPSGTRFINIVGLYADGTSGFWVTQNESTLADSSGTAFSATEGGTVGNMSLLQAFGDSATDGTPVVVYEITSGNVWNSYVVFEHADGSGIASEVRHAGLSSRGALIGDVGHVVLNYTSPGLQNCYFLYDWYESRPVARFAYGNAGAGYNKGQLPGLYSSDGVNFSFAGLMRRRISTLGDAFEADASDASTFENDELERFAITYGLKAESLEVGQSTYLAQGTLLAYSGVKCEESAPFLFPEYFPDPDEVSTYTNALAAGATYLYRVYYERVRPNSEETRSLALTFLATIGGANRSLRLYLPTLSHTMSKAAGDWRITVYRTEANSTSLFYLVTSSDLTATTAPNNYVANDVTEDVIWFYDDMSDALLIKNKLDPQSQGVLPAVQPACATVMGETNYRLFLAGGEYDTGVIAPSLLVFPGEAVLFSDELQFSLGKEGGAVTAMGAIDGVLVAFKERTVYAVTGDGPSDTGSGASFNVQRVTTDVGCTAPGSVVETPDGLMFQSAKGMYIIDRSFNTEYIGWPVESFNNSCIVSAEVIPNTNSVVFLTSEGQSLSYDYFFKQWSTWTGHAGLDSVVVGGEYHYLRSDGEVYTRNESAYLDAGSWYTMRLRTAPIRLDSVQDYLRVRRVNILGEYLSSHRLQMKVYNNRDIAPFETRIFEPDNVIDLTLWGDADTALWGDADTTPWGGTAGATDYQFQHKFKRQKVQYLRLEFEDLQTGAAPGQSYELAEMNFEIGQYDGNARIPARRKL